MKRYALLFILFLMVQSIHLQPLCAQTPDPKGEAFASMTLSKIKGGEFESLFNDFYFPKGIEETAKQHHKRALTYSFETLLQKHIGMPSTFESAIPGKKKTLKINFSAAPSDGSSDLQSSAYYYETAFADFGDGGILVEVCEEQGKYYVKAITIDLPVTDEAKVAIVQNYMDFMKTDAKWKTYSNS